MVSNFAEVFVKELVKEVTKAKKNPAPQQQISAASVAKPTKNDPQQPIAFAKGQVMILEWVPTSKQETGDRGTKRKGGRPAAGKQKRTVT